MKTLAQYAQEHAQNAQSAPQFVLLKRPSAGGPVPLAATVSREARTATVALAANEAPDPEWRVIALPATSALPDGASIAVGRAPRCDIVLPYNSVSKLHASLRAVNGTFVVGDEGSANGTFVDGKRIVAGEMVPVGPGSTVTFGGVTFEFVPHEVALETARGLGR